MHRCLPCLWPAVFLANHYGWHVDARTMSVAHQKRCRCSDGAALSRRLKRGLLPPPPPPPPGPPARVQLLTVSSPATFASGSRAQITRACAAYGTLSRAAANKAKLFAQFVSRFLLMSLSMTLSMTTERHDMATLSKGM